MGAVAYAILGSALFAVVFLTHYNPGLLGDENKLLKTLVDEQILNILGVIIAIFLPSAAALYIRLAELEREIGLSLYRFRRKIRINCGTVIVLFAAMIVLLVIKGKLGSNEAYTSAVNGLAIVFLLENILVLVDLTLSMFEVGEASIRTPAKPTGKVEHDNSQRCEEVRKD